MAGEADTLERWFAIADANRDGRIEGTEAITFFQRSGLPRETLKEIWGKTAGTQAFMNKQQFYGAIRLVSLAQLSGGAFTPMQAQQLLMGTAPPPPLPKLSGLTPETWAPSTPPAMQYTGGHGHPPTMQYTGGHGQPPTMQYTGGHGQPPPMQYTGGHGQPPPMQYTGGSLSGTTPTVQVTGGGGQVPYQYTGGRTDVKYPPLPIEEATRYGQIFQSLDTDYDGLVQGAQCIELFSSRGVDRNTLKQIWQLVAGNAGQINRDQFGKCLYLIEISKQGIPLPPVLPAGAFPPIAQSSGHSSVQQQSYGQGGIPSLPNRAVYQTPEPAGYPGWRGPVANEGMVSTLDPIQRDRLMAEKMEAQKKDQQLYVMDQSAETARNKREFYEKALQELMLFKSRMDVATMEVQEKLKREQDFAVEAEKRYEQIRYGAEEAAREAGNHATLLQEAERRKAEVEAKLAEAEQQLAAQERVHPEMIHQVEMQIQGLQDSVTGTEARRNKLIAELESFKHQQELLHRRQGDLQMACAAAEAEVHSASGDIDKLTSQVESIKESNDTELIQKLLRESARVYSNLHSHACKAGVEIPVEARLSLYGNDVTWSDDLIGAGIDVSSWQEDGFVLVDAFPDVKDDMDAEFEKAIQEAVNNIKMNETTKTPLTNTGTATPGAMEFAEDLFQVTASATQPPVADFAAFEAFPLTDMPSPPVVTSTTPSKAPIADFAVSFDEPVAASLVPKEASTPTDPVSSSFAAFDDNPVFPTQQTESTQPVSFEADFSGFATAFPGTQDSSSSAAVTNKDTTSADLFGDSAFS